MWINFPAALALVASLWWLLQQHEARVKASVTVSRGAPQWRQAKAQQAHGAHAQVHVQHARTGSVGGSDSKGKEGRWRERV